MAFKFNILKDTLFYKPIYQIFSVNLSCTVLSSCLLTGV